MDYRAVLTDEVLSEAYRSWTEVCANGQHYTVGKEQARDVLVAALEAAAPPDDPFGDHAWGHRAANELAKLIEIIRFAPGQPTGFLHSAHHASELLLRWASKWAARPASEPVQTCATCQHGDRSAQYKALIICGKGIRTRGISLMGEHDRYCDEDFSCNQWEAGAPARTKDGE